MQRLYVFVAIVLLAKSLPLIFDCASHECNIINRAFTEYIEKIKQLHVSIQKL